MSTDKVDIFIPIYIGDYLADTADLNAEEHGAYLLILMTMWRTRLALPLDRLDRIARVEPEQWNRVWGAIGRFFDVSDGRVTQRRLMRELEASLEKRRRASDRGRKGGLARAQAQADTESDASCTHGEEESKHARLTLTPLPFELLQEEKKTGPSRQSARDLPARSEPCAKDAVVGLVPNWERYKMPFDVTPTFSEVFAKYPNQVGQAKAASAWCAIVEAGYLGGEPALRGVVTERFGSGQLARHPYSGDSKYRPSFETYLREFRWLDADSAPDPTPEVKAQPENFAQRDARAAREAAERTQRSLDRDVANTAATLTTCPVHLYGPREDRKCNKRCPMWEGPSVPDSPTRTLAENKAVARG